MFNGFLDPVLAPLLASMGSFWFLISVSVFAALAGALIQKYTTDQALMKRLREELNEHQKEMKLCMKDEKKLKAVQAKMWAKQGQMMKQTMSIKSFLVNSLVFVLLLGWLSGHLAYNPILPSTPFSVTMDLNSVQKVSLSAPSQITIDNATKEGSTVSWNLNGESGEYLLEWNVNGKAYTHSVLITSDERYIEPVKKVNDGVVKDITIGNVRKKVFDLGFIQLGWFGSYFWMVIIFGSILRKALKVY